jgi:arginase
MASPVVTAATNRIVSAPIQSIVAPIWLGAERAGVDLGAIELGRRLAEWAGEAPRILPAAHVPCPVPADALSRLNRRDLAFVDAVAAACSGVRDRVAAAIVADRLAVVLGGDHAVAMGSLAGATEASGRVGVLWLDSHLDLNTPESSPSGHLHGMALAVALGDGPAPLTALFAEGRTIDPGDICFLGVRSIDLGEAARLQRTPLYVRTMDQWRQDGIGGGVWAALEHLRVRGVSAVHVSFDLDVLDPAIMPGTGTPVPDGLSLDGAREAVAALRAWPGPIRSLDWVELNPALDPSGTSETLACELLMDLLGSEMAERAG